MRYHAFDIVEFKARPKKDGLHDSGYRFIETVGVRFVGSPAGRTEERTVLGTSSDNLRFEVGPAVAAGAMSKFYPKFMVAFGISIDIAEDGRQRAWCRNGRLVARGWDTDYSFLSDAEFYPVPRGTPDTFEVA